MFVYVCTHVWLYVLVLQKTEVQDPRGVGVPDVNCSVWVVGAEIGSSARPVSILNHLWAISPDPPWYFEE